jgi:hypothetical protein
MLGDIMRRVAASEAYDRSVAEYQAMGGGGPGLPPPPVGYIPQQDRAGSIAAYSQPLGEQTRRYYMDPKELTRKERNAFIRQSEREAKELNSRAAAAAAQARAAAQADYEKQLVLKIASALRAGKSRQAAAEEAMAAMAAPAAAAPQLNAEAPVFQPVPRAPVGPGFYPLPSPDAVLNAYYAAPADIQSILRETGAFELSGVGHYRGSGIRRFNERCFFD